MNIREKIQQLGFDTVYENPSATFKILTDKLAPKSMPTKALRAERGSLVTPWRSTWSEVLKDVYLNAQPTQAGTANPLITL